MRRGRKGGRTDRYPGYDLANAAIQIEQHPVVVRFVEGLLQELLRAERHVLRGHAREPRRGVRQDDRVSYDASAAQFLA